MFRFFYKRYTHKMRSMRGLFIFVLVPALLYLGVAANQTDRYKMYQKIKLVPDAPLALSGSPSEFTSIDWFVTHPDELFLDTYTLQVLSRELQKELLPQAAVMTEAQLVQGVKSSMSLSYVNNVVFITYSGTDQALGEVLVGFYAKKVTRKVEDGLKRQEMLAARKAAQEEGRVSAIPAVESYCSFKGGLMVEGQKALWRSERLPMTLVLLGAGLVVVLVWIGVLEMLDTSFKSERQVARMLHIPVLGCVPNLKRVSKVMGGAKP